MTAALTAALPLAERLNPFGLDEKTSEQENTQDYNDGNDDDLDQAHG